MISRLMLKRAPRHRASAARSGNVAWGKLTAITFGVMAFGIVAGAAFAAPDELLPLARSLSGAVGAAVVPLLSSAATFAGDLINGGSGVVASVLAGEYSLRTLAMIVTSVLAGVFALTAMVLSYRSKRSTAVRADTTPLSLIVAPATSVRRSSHPTPKQVLTLAQQGASLSDIARRTGMPVDAVSVLLAIADPARQLQS